MNTNHQNNILSKITNIKAQIAELIDRTELERKENSGEDSILLQQLEDKKEYLIKQLDDLKTSLHVCNTQGCGEKIYKILLDGRKKQVSVVIPSLANPSKGHISNESPLARALLNKQKGETVQMNTPSGTKDIKIIDLE